MTELPPHVLFYDGVCAMCNGIVKYMLRVDEGHVFHFAPLQGETAELARKLDMDPVEPRTGLCSRSATVCSSLRSSDRV